MDTAVLLYDQHPTFKEVGAAIADCLRRRFSEVRVAHEPAIDITERALYLVLGSDYCLDHCHTVIRQIALGRPRRATIVLWHNERLPLPNATSEVAERNLATFTRNYRIYDAIFMGEEGKRRYLSSLGIDTGFAPVGFHPIFDKGLAGLPRTMDAFFVGWMNQRRADALDLVARKANVFGSTWVWGRDRDVALSSSKVVLNIHFDHYNVLEGIRFLHGMANGALVVSETVDFPQPYVPGKHFVMAELEDLGERVAHFVEHEEERMKIVNRAARFLQEEHTMEKSVHAILATVGL